MPFSYKFVIYEPNSSQPTIFWKRFKNSAMLTNFVNEMHSTVKMRSMVNPLVKSIFINLD